MNALCQMTGLSRAGFYRWRVPRRTEPVEMELRDQMQKVAWNGPVTAIEESPLSFVVEVSQ